MTMDNFQRTEHLLSYCPQLLGLSSQNATPKETIKKLSMYFTFDLFLKLIDYNSKIFLI
jgi:hypothetical protein